jgi:hypothetical protein
MPLTNLWTQSADCRIDPSAVGRQRLSYHDRRYPSEFLGEAGGSYLGTAKGAKRVGKAKTFGLGSCTCSGYRPT